MGWLSKIFGFQAVTDESVGIDVSHHNGTINWSRVKDDPQNISYAFIKATQGIDYVDPKFIANVQGCKAAGIKWGAYHYATWNNKDVIKDAKFEAAHFLSKVQLMGKPDMPLVLDAESNDKPPLSPEELLTFITIFIGEVKKAGYDIMLYSFPSWINSYLPKNHGLGAKCKLWLADYSGPINPVNGFKPYIHQYTDKGTVNGIKTDVDMNKIL